ncbi:MAG TPA: hypothetical protein VGC25_01625, partial [Alphaproteobacteria bacterium]
GLGIGLRKGFSVPLALVFVAIDLLHVFSGRPREPADLSCLETPGRAPPTPGKILSMEGSEPRPTVPAQPAPGC